jgi:hypothetical protein
MENNIMNEIIHTLELIPLKYRVHIDPRVFINLMRPHIWFRNEQIELYNLNGDYLKDNEGRELPFKAFIFEFDSFTEFQNPEEIIDLFKLSRGIFKIERC